MFFFARLKPASVLLLAALVVLPTVAHGQAARGAPSDASSRAALVAERQRVRGDLERANAEIDALKRSGRGLREDYRLRERLADAEALARRLTELDARLGGAAAPAAHDHGAEPRVSPADGPAELDAKADILADQAQRLAARGDQLLGRARDLRDRQTLRRRVGQMERDPFSPLEGSKRRAMTGTVAVSGPVAARPAPAGGDTKTLGPTATDMAAGGGPQTAVGTGAPHTTGEGAGAAFTPASPGASTAPPSASTATPAAPSGSAVSSPTAAPTPTSASDVGALSVQLRDLLDPTTLAEIQRLETTGGARTSSEALERAGAALKARAERLRQQAAALRASEHAVPRAR
jgi:hypothetical protein